MSTPRIPNQKTQYKKLNERLSKYMASVLSIYESLNKEAAKIALSTDYDGTGEFSFDDYPITKDRVKKLQQKFVSDLGGVIMSGTSEEWKNSNLLQDMIADKVLGKYVGEHNGKEFEHYYQKNSGALKAFQQRKDKGLNLSQKLWNQSADYKTELEEILSVSIEKGIDAVTLSKRVSKYLWDFPSMQAAYEEKFGHASRAKNCEYRSIRLARSEINMAYRTAEQERWRQFDFVIGYEIKLSGSHPVTDVCDDLKGKYPKDFEFLGWHPNCYTDQAQVLTDKGWKFFVDVKQDDMILSLNPNTKDVEWTRISATQCYPYKGEIVRFYNKSLECSVTPDHQMVYLNKGDGSIKKTTALNYRKGLGAFYRTCVHKDQNERKFIDINGDIWNFDDYCEFMGYWLADGSVQHTTGVVLSQKVGEPARQPMIECIKRLGYKFTENEFAINVYRSAVARYLSQFGVCNEKFVPQEIFQASRRQINIFLDAFIKCDGYVRKCKSFVGNRNAIFNTENDERMYFTTSQRLAGDICHLLLLIGHRPSFVLKDNTITTKKDGSTIKGNYKCYNIRECYSGSSTVFDKEMLNYDGNVYDVTLEKNHIMYISYNGKCFWGSNCMCYAVPILKTEDEYFADEDVKSENEVTDVPKNFKEWATGNWNRIAAAEKRGTLPYFLRDNKEYYQKELSIKKAAVLRHKNRDAKAIQLAWDNRSALQERYGKAIGKIRRSSRYWGVDTTELELYLQNGNVNIDEYGFDDNLEKIISKIGAETNRARVAANLRFEKLRNLKEELSMSYGDYRHDDIISDIEKFLSNHNPNSKELSYGAVYEPTKVAEINEYIREQKKRIQKRIDVLHTQNIAMIEDELDTYKMVPMSFDEADQLRANPMFLTGERPYRVNCQSCVVAYELRRQGFDVEALPNMEIAGSPQDRLSYNTANIWIDRKTGRPPKKEYVSIAGLDDNKALSSVVDRIQVQGRYHVSLTWKQRDEKGNVVGHVFTIERKRNGTIFAYDPQDGVKTDDTALLEKYLSLASRGYRVHIYRVDNCDINTNSLSKIVKKK